MGKTILVVDDDPVVRFLLSECLAMHGHSIVAFERGRDSLAWLESQRPDLVMVDMMMPEMNGIEVVTAIRSNEKLATLPIIMLSANADRKVVKEVSTHEPNHYVEKPWDLPTLLATIDQLSA